MPVGNESNHVVNGLTVLGGLGFGVNGPFMNADDQLGNSMAGQRYNTIETVPRFVISGTAVTSGRIFFMMFTSPLTKTITTMEFINGTTAAGATPTLVRYGLYTVDVPLGTASPLTGPVASTVNDTAIFAGSNTAYPKALSAPYTLQAGVRYAAAMIVVTAAALPTPLGVNGGYSAGILTSIPQMNAFQSSQTDLTTNPTPTYTAGGIPYYCAMS